MTKVFHNSQISSNVLSDGRTLASKELKEEPLEIQFPIKLVKSADLGNKPLGHIDAYISNRKTMAQNIFNKKNLNEHLNFKNTFYVSERGDLANKEANTIYGHGKIYNKDVVEADLKAQYHAKTWKENHIAKEEKVKQGFQDTANTVSNRRNEKAKTNQQEDLQHRKEVKKYFRTIQNFVGTMVGNAPVNLESNFRIPDTHDETNEIEAYNIKKIATDEENILNNRANIRSLMGSRSAENQEKVRQEKEEREKIAALEEAHRVNLERQEEIKISKYLDLQNLSQKWKIFDKEKLKQTVRNEIMKTVLKEEERNNFEKVATFKGETRKKEPIKKASSPKPKTSPPRAYSPTKKGKKKKSSKKYVFSPEKIQKLPKESQGDYKKRFGFATMALAKEKDVLNPVEKHKITKEFHEMVIQQGLMNNGNLAAE